MNTSSLPIEVGEDLRVSIRDGTATITPAEGLALAERLIRASCRAMMAEEAGAARSFHPANNEVSNGRRRQTPHR